MVYGGAKMAGQRGRASGSGGFSPAPGKAVRGRKGLTANSGGFAVRRKSGDIKRYQLLSENISAGAARSQAGGYAGMRKRRR